MLIKTLQIPLWELKIWAGNMQYSDCTKPDVLFYWGVSAVET
jgi:hypothetical protein